MTKTIHPGGEGDAYSRGGVHFKFRPLGGAVIRRGCLFKGGGGALIRRFTALSIGRLVLVLTMV